MIKKIDITNFKGVKDTVSIELKPVTLLFGPNSAGKSTIIQAIHYALEILDRNNIDSKTTLLGGSSIELGGFKNLVHNHDLSRKIKLKFEIDLKNTELTLDHHYDFDPSFKKDITEIINNQAKSDRLVEDIEERLSSRNNILSYVEQIHEQSQTAYVELSVEWLEQVKRPEVTSIEFGLDAIEYMRIGIDKFDSNGKLYPKISFINFDHPNFVRIIDPFEDIFNDVIGGGNASDQNILIEDSNSVIPDWNKGIKLPYENYKNSVDSDYVAYSIIDTLEITCQLVVGLGLLLIDELTKFKYIGPMREVPTRNFDPHFSGEIERWANGLGAWDYVYNRPGIIPQINEWMDKLKIDYHLKMAEFYEVPTDYLSQKTMGNYSDILKDFTSIQSRVDSTIRKLLSEFRAKSFMKYKDISEASQILKESISDLIHNSMNAIYEQIEPQGDTKGIPNGLFDKYINKKISNSDLKTGIKKEVEKSFEKGKEVLLQQVLEIENVNYESEQLINLLIEKLLEETESRFLQIVDNLQKMFDEEKLNSRIAELPIKKQLFLIDTQKNIKLRPPDVGIGISQVLPVIIGVLVQSSSMLAIEQPELHIHPAIQVELADLFINQINQKDDVVYLIETHSEHFLLRLLNRIREPQRVEESLRLSYENLAINFIEVFENSVLISPLEITKSGRFKNRWPHGFFDERKRELF